MPNTNKPDAARRRADKEERLGRIEGTIAEQMKRQGLPTRLQSMPYSSLGKGLPAYKKGGKVKKTGLAKLHKGEHVLTAKQAKAKAKRVASPRKRAR